MLNIHDSKWNFFRRTLGGNNANNSSNRRPSFPNTGRSSPFYANNNQKFGVGTFAVGSNAPQPMGSNGPSNATVGSGRSNISSNANSRPFTPQGRSNSIGGGPYAGNPRYHQGYQQGHGSVYGANGSLAGASFANTTNKAFGSSVSFSSIFNVPQLLFRSRKKFSTTYAIVLFFSRPFNKVQISHKLSIRFYKISHSHSTPSLLRAQ